MPEKLERRDARVGDEGGAVLADVVKVADPEAVALEVLDDTLDDAAVLVRGVAVLHGDVLADQLAGFVAEHRVLGRVGIQDKAALVGDADALGHALEHAGAQAQLVLDELVLGDVLDLDDGADGGPIGDDRAGGEGDGEEAAVLADEHVLAALLLALRQGAVDRALGDRVRPAVGVTVVDEVVQRPALHLGDRVADHRHGGGVHEGAVLPRVHQEQRRGGVVGDRAGQLVLSLQRALGVATLGDVAEDVDDEAHGAGLVEHGGRGQDRPAVTVAAAGPEADQLLVHVLAAKRPAGRGLAVGDRRALGVHHHEAAEQLAGGRGQQGGNVGHADRRGGDGVGVDDLAAVVHQRDRVGDPAEHDLELLPRGPQLPLRALACGDVHRHADEAQDLAVGRDVRGVGRVDPALTAIAVIDRDLEARQLARQRRLDVRSGPREGGLADHLTHVPADDVLARAPEPVGVAVVDEAVAAGRVDVGQQRGRLFEDQAHLLQQRRVGPGAPQGVTLGSQRDRLGSQRVELGSQRVGFAA